MRWRRRIPFEEVMGQTAGIPNVTQKLVLDRSESSRG
jgi:hypothetical protein